MKGHDRMKRFLRALNRYTIFFLLVAFVITSCLSLFVTVLSKSLGITLTEENVALAAKITFWNVLLISAIFALIDTLRRKLTVDRSVKHIVEATKRMIEGDFDVRISRLHHVFSDDRFNEIIDCVNLMAKELSGVETLRNDFVSNVSHEMKTPLAAMQNYSILLQEETLSDEKRMEYAKAITDAARRLSNMMTNILRLNRLDNQTVYPRTQRYELSEALCESVLLYENVWEDKGITVETDLDEGIFVTDDRELLSCVWNNLLSNAFKFTEAGGSVRITLKREGEYAVVTVADTGCGMSPEVGAHIFEKFYQGDTSHATEGNGLGLALVRRVVDIIGGEISVMSREGEGSCFIVRLKRDCDRNETLA